jgi:hypothetical protein
VIYLSGCHNASTVGVENLGLLVQPMTSYESHIPKYSWWAADNACFAQGEAFDEGKWWRWIWKIRGEAWASPRRSFCLFAVAPDVVADPLGTYKRGWTRLYHLRNHGLPAAFCAQDGLETYTAVHRASFWDEFDCLFIGGTTEWKEGPGAAWLVSEALARRKWVHCGRVNSYRRLELAASFGCQSVDGTYIAYGPRVNLPRLQGWLERVNSQMRLKIA